VLRYGARAPYSVTIAPLAGTLVRFAPPLESGRPARRDVNPPPKPAWRRLLAAALLIAVSCGDGNAVWKARSSITGGDLELAEKQIAGAEGPEADKVRAEIAAVREHRADVTKRIDELHAKVGVASQNELTARLRELRDREKDPVSRDAIERALSGLAERFLDARTRNPSAARVTAEEMSADEKARARETVSHTRSEIREALEAHQWRRVSALLVMLADQPRELVGDLSPLRDELASRSRLESERLLAQAGDLEREQGPEAAHRWLAGHAERFPATEEHSDLHESVRVLKGRALAARAPNEREEPVEEVLRSDSGLPTELEEIENAVLSSKPVPEDVDPGELARLASEAAAAGDLAYARQCWLAASRKLPAGDLRDDYVGQAQDLRTRLILRSELIDACRADRGKFADLGIDTITRDGWKLADGGTRLWKELALDELLRAGAHADLSSLARRGIVGEALRSSDKTERARAAAELASMVERGEILGADASAMVSRAFGGIDTSERYLIERGKWVPQSVAEAEKRVEDEQRLVKEFLAAKGGQLDGAFEALLGGASELAVRKALHERTKAAFDALGKGRTLTALEGLAELRTELDAARKSALDAIFDEKTYFYPYDPPEPPKTMTDYVRAQQHVDELVEAAREVWGRSKKVKVSKDFHAAAAEVEWCREAHASLGIDFELPEKCPEWVLAVPADATELDLETFAWTAGEGRDLAYDRAVLARNEKLFAQAADKTLAIDSPDALPNVAEMEQVRITNDYRRMLGRRVLAWNPKLQAAAQGHSEYMANTGHFGHFEEGDPQRRSPFDRMKLAGYSRGVSENCAMVGGDPKAAHDGWLRSSGHHRNILMSGHREMASGSASNYWTQNYGADTAFQSELELENEGERAAAGSGKKGSER
jgi:uncharacterized protein YkwD